MRRVGLAWSLAFVLAFGCGSGSGGSAGTGGGAANGGSGGNASGGKGGASGGAGGVSTGGDDGSMAGSNGAAGGGIGGGGIGGGGIGGGGIGGAQIPADLISDFEDPAAATVVRTGTPPRNGVWYTYNDDPFRGFRDPTCIQTPRTALQSQAMNLPPEPYLSVAPPGGPPPGSTGTRALHGEWTGCAVWGAGVGAELATPIVDGGLYVGPRVPYDVRPYIGVSFWARATVESDTAFRVSFPMTDDASVEDGGNCV